jgi:hypothetical protein
MSGDPVPPRRNDMIQMIPMPADHVIGVRMSGKMEKADIDRTAKAIEEKLTVHDKVNIYAEIESFEGISLEALVADIKFAFPHLRDFAKKAVVSEKHWIEKLVAIGDKWFPSVEVRHFSFDQKDEALKWAQAS